MVCAEDTSCPSLILYPIYLQFESTRHLEKQLKFFLFHITKQNPKIITISPNMLAPYVLKRVIQSVRTYLFASKASIHPQFS